METLQIVLNLLTKDSVHDAVLCAVFYSLLFLFAYNSRQCAVGSHASFPLFPFSFGDEDALIGGARCTYSSLGKEGKGKEEERIPSFLQSSDMRIMRQ